ncbi:MAG: aminotransferase class III-fold pyridoxal phosphate-dependent enzyme [Theionarchaea archaeon]|nr:MAG: aminotransferase [Theionarchaea archaeon DG-70-1]MBU7029058.1 aminotransferase class III-fold pyridoxal phosphate-dependent enzyme [Theionarchaea archaeon]
MEKEDLAAFEQHLIKSWSVQGGWKPNFLTKAEGSWLYDKDGKKILDFSSQLICSNLGHGHPKVSEAIRTQTEKIAFVHSAFATEPVAKLAKLIADITPGDLTKVFLSSSGCEANEAAIKTARFFTGAHKILSRYRSYHGSTYGAIALTGDPRRWWVEPGGVPGVIMAPDAYCYRCPFGKAYPGCGITCATYVDYMIEYEGGGDKVAAMVLEPIVGSNGVIVPPDEYLPMIRKICDKWGVLLIDDEVMTGFGRTGEWFAVNHWGVVPDIMTMAKGLTGAHIPLGATVLRKKIAEYFDENLFCHGHTYVAHPLPCAAGVAAIDAYKEENLIENARRMGEYLGKRLKELKDTHKSVGDIRGKGLFWAVEPVKNRKTKEPFCRVSQKFEQTTMNKLSQEAMKKGVYVLNIINILMVAPPLVVTEEEIDYGVDALDEVLTIADAEAAG